VWCLVGAVLVAFGNGLGFAMWVLGNGLWLQDFLKKKEYEEAAMWAGFTVTATLGTLNWVLTWL
jgi:hypothetical protein